MNAWDKQLIDSQLLLEIENADLFPTKTSGSTAEL